MNWRKSTHSGSGGTCVEVARDGYMTHFRDSKLGEDSPILSFNKAEMNAFLMGAKDGEFDI